MSIHRKTPKDPTTILQKFPWPNWIKSLVVNDYQIRVWILKNLPSRKIFKCLQFSVDEINKTPKSNTGSKNSKKIGRSWSKDFLNSQQKAKPMVIHTEFQRSGAEFGFFSREEFSGEIPFLFICTFIQLPVICGIVPRPLQRRGKWKLRGSGPRGGLLSRRNDENRRKWGRNRAPPTLYTKYEHGRG